MWRFMLCVTAAGFAITSAGCGRLVSSREFIDTAMAPHHGDVAATVDRQNDWEPQEARLGEIRLPLTDEETTGLVASSRARLSGMDVRYLAQVHNQLEAMRLELIRVAVRADQKGATGRAAIDPKLRNFITSLRLITRYVTQFRDGDVTEFDSLKVKIDAELKSARDALREAADDVDRVRDAGHLLASTRNSPYAVLWSGSSSAAAASW